MAKAAKAAKAADGRLQRYPRTCRSGLIHQRRQGGQAIDLGVVFDRDADGTCLLQWVQQRLPQWAPALRAHLVAWGGNSSGVNVANIDNLGDVHPDTMWWHHRLGNVRERPFSQIWADTSDPLMTGLQTRP